MDLKGSLTDTSLKIYPSSSLLNFLKNHSFTQPLPLNIAKIVSGEGCQKKNEVEEKPKPIDVSLNNKDTKVLTQILHMVDEALENEVESVENPKQESPNKKSVSEKDSKGTEDSDDETEPSKETKETDTESKVKIDWPSLSTRDIEWLYVFLKEKRAQDSNTPYIHELLQGSHIELPKNQILKRNPDLEARCVKLRAQQEAREYRKMTKGIDNVRMRFPEDSISYQLKQMNRQLIAIGQFIISIFAGFLFGFQGIEWMVGNLDFGFRLLLGVMCALVIALAEIYFLAKKLNEELSVPETTQLGGPPKFVDESLNENRIRKTIEKQHQD